MNLEEKLTRGKIVYFDAVEYNPDLRQLVLKVVTNPEIQVVEKLLIFLEVQNYSEEFFDEEEEELLEASTEYTNIPKNREVAM